MAGGIHVAALGVASFVAVALLVPVTRQVAIRYGVTDLPTTGKLHTAVTPYLGGVAIVLATLGISAFVPSWTVQAAAVILGACLVGLVGLIDDVRTLGPLMRVAAEAIAGSIAFASGARVHLVNDPVDWALTVGWLVVVTNSFNLLDNMDGAAGAIATITAVALTVAAVLQGQVLVGGLAVVVSGACLGFLLYNWYPARIFMGDAGSLFLGFLLASISLKLKFGVHQPASVVAVGLLMGPALFDTTLVVITRLRERRPIYIGATDHTAHRLLRLGLPTPAVVGTLALGTAACGALGTAVGLGVVSAWFSAPVFVVAVAFLGALLRVEGHEVTVANPRRIRDRVPAFAEPGEVTALAAVEAGG